MSKRNEVTPFVIDFKPNTSNYGAADTDAGAATPGSPASCSRTCANNNNTALPSTPSAIYCLHGHGQSNVEVRDHCHQSRTEGVDVKARKKLIIASILCLLFMVCEIIGGILSNSLAIATDAAHLLTDFASFMISLFAIWIAGRPSTQRMSFGWYRAEVIGALASVVMIWFITAILVWLAVERLINRDFELEAGIMLITSGLAILVNLIMGFQLQHGHSHGGMSPAPTGAHSHGAPPACKVDKKDKKSMLIDALRRKKNSEDKTCSNACDIAAQNARSSASEELVYSTPPECPASPVASLERGVNSTDLAAVEAQGNGVGVQSFSYQNSVDTRGMNANTTETDPGAHYASKNSKANVNMNVRAALIHVVGDVVQSVGVFIAALFIYFNPDWAIVDPICTFIFSVIVLCTTFAILKDALLVLMEGTPSYMHYTEVLEVFQQIEGVQRVHNLRIWALSINKIALSVHLAIAPHANPKQILQEATKVVHLRYNFFETTIQIEEETPQMESCKQCIVPVK